VAGRIAIEESSFKPTEFCLFPGCHARLLRKPPFSAFQFKGIRARSLTDRLKTKASCFRQLRVIKAGTDRLLRIQARRM